MSTANSDAKRLLDALLRLRGGGIAAAATAGGAALIAGIGLRALRGRAEGAQEAEGAAAPAAAAPAKAPANDPFREANDDEARLYLRAMIAAISADGLVDARERGRLEEAATRAGIGEAEGRWLRGELAEPASIDEIADRVGTPEAAARVYAAARLAIDPDTMQERAFLKMLAEALDVGADATARIETELA